MSGGVDVKLYQAVDDHNLDLAAGRCDAILADVGSIIDFMESDGGVDVALYWTNFFWSYKHLVMVLAVL